MASKRDAIQHFDLLLQKVNRPYLRDFLMKRASSLESFLAIRSQSARSLAALNICSWLLGKSIVYILKF